MKRNYLGRAAFGLGAHAARSTYSRARDQLGRFTKKRRTAAKKGGNRRRRARTVRRQSGKRKTFESSGAILSGTSVNYGKRMRKSNRNLWRVVDSNSERIKFGYTSITPYGGVRGGNFLTHYQTTPGTNIIAPLHMYDITSAPNVVNNVATFPPSYYELNFNQEIPSAVTWTASTLYQIQNAPHAQSINSDYMGGRSMLEWLKVKMLLYAPGTIPVRINVELVQLTDQRLHPADAATFGTQPFVVGFWEYMSKQYMTNPICEMDTRYSKYVKVLKKFSFYMDPKEAGTETNVNTHYKKVDIFKWFNRRCRYDWNDGDIASLAFTNAGAGDFQVNNDEKMDTKVHPKARIYLMVRGQSNLSTSINDTTVWPSYDMNVSIQHRKLE